MRRQWRFTRSPIDQPRTVASDLQLAPVLGAPAPIGYLGPLGKTFRLRGHKEPTRLYRLRISGAPSAA